MRKKYLSALLFGALLFASAGTFTSCKDYDDDINGLRTEITDLKSAVTELQNAVQNGKYVTAVSGNGNVITFTFSDGSTTPITIETESGEPSQTVTIGEDGEIIINGEGTGYYTTTQPTEAEVEAGLTKQQNGTWWVLGEDGEYTDTKIPVSGITVSGSEAEGYTFTIVDANGVPQNVKLPTAASAITEMTLGGHTNNPRIGTASGEVSFVNSTYSSAVNNGVYVSRQKFTFTPSTIVGDEIKSASDWKGNKTLPEDNDYIYSSPTRIDLRIDPVSVPAENIQFTLTNTKNNDLSPIVLTANASQDSDQPPMSNTNSRAAVTGNGLWTLSMANQIVKANVEDATWNAIKDAETGKWLYSVNANDAFRSEYQLVVAQINPQSLTDLAIKGEGGTFTFCLERPVVNGLPYKSDYEGTTYAGQSDPIPTLGDQNVTYKTGKEYTVAGVQSSALYDMYLTADQSDIDVYGLTFDQSKHTFTIGKNPDVSSIPAEFDLIIYTVDNAGYITKTTVSIVLNSQISAEAEYSLIDHNVNYSDPTDNLFYIDLATMKTALGDNLNQWMQNVDLGTTAITYDLYSNENCSNSSLVASNIDFDGTNVFDAQIVPTNTKNASETTDRNQANYIRIHVDNNAVATYNATAVSGHELQLDKTYYVKVSFKATSANGGGDLNSIVVPVEFHAPELSDLFTIAQAFQDDIENGVLNAYFYKVEGVIANGHEYTASEAGATVNLDRYFSSYVPDAKVSFASGNVGDTGKSADQLFSWGTLNYNGASNNNKDSDGDQVFSTGSGNSLATSTTLGFNSANPGINNGQAANGYGEAITINVNKDNFEGWLYTQDGDDEYSFQIRLMSPIYEGSVDPVSGTSIVISGNDLVRGASITNDMIIGHDYNNNTFSVIPDDDSATSGTRTESVVMYNTTMAKPGNLTADDYTHPQIASIVPGTNQYFENVEVWSAYTDDNVIIPGEFRVYGASISQTVTVDMPVTVKDAWGYILEDEVPVTIQRNE